MAAIAGGMVGIALLLAGSGVTQRESAPSVDVALKVERDGALAVTERVVVPRGEVTRSVPSRVRADAGADPRERVFTVQDASVAGNGHAEATEGGLSISLGPGESTVRYVVRGAVADAHGEQEVRWRIASGWNTALGAVTASFAAPAPEMSVTDCFAGPPGSARACTLAGVDHTGVVRLEQDGLATGDRLELVVGLPPGTVPADARIDPVTTFAGAFEPTWISGIAFGALALLLAAGALALRLARGRDASAPVADPGPVGVLLAEGDRAVFASPDGVLPGQVGTVVDESVDPVDIGATVLDLAVRNYLWITEVPGAGGTADWRFSRRNRPSPADESLHAFELAVLDALLPAGTDSTTLGELWVGGRLDVLPIREAMYRDVVRQGWFSPRALTGRGALTWLGAGFAVAGTGLTFVLACTVGHALTGVAVLLAGLALTAGSSLLPRRTGRGRALAGQLRGLLRYLHEVDVRDIPARDRELVFSRSLPYVVVLGETERWLRAFCELDPEAEGASGVHWFGGFEGERNLHRFGTHLPRFLNALDGLLAEAGHLRSLRTAVPAAG
ncbi:DUF2207 family protein [Amycolatopsis cihanbeyliensis]|nr:DUF2207 domain-containing protein [Amycolatopsis cihanbeyliensis]